MTGSVDLSQGTDHQVSTPPQPRDEKHIVCFGTDDGPHDSNAISHDLQLPLITESRGDHAASHGVTDNTAQQESKSKDKDAIRLPPILANKTAPSKEEAVTSHNAIHPSTVDTNSHESSTNSKDANELSLLQELERANLSEDEGSESNVNDDLSDRTSSDESCSSSSDDDDDGSAKQSKMPNLQGLSVLPLPAILHYMRESESMASRYFSLQNRAEVKRRSEEAKLGLGANCDDGQDTGSAETQGRNHQDETDGRPKDAEEDSSISCHFCGKKLPRRTLLADVQDIDKIKEEVV